MSHPDHETIVFTLPSKDDVEGWNAFNDAMEAINDNMLCSIEQLSKELNIRENCAAQILYLRSRSRWSQELEDRMLAAFRAGHEELNTLAGEEEENLQRLGF